jgi:DNA processing protein
MADLYSLSQVIKNHPIYRFKQFEIHELYKKLGKKNLLSPSSVLAEVQQKFPEMFFDLQKSFKLYLSLREENIKLKLKGYSLVCLGEELYPPTLYLMEDPPLTLTYLGSPSWLSGQTISVVGSREPQSESLLWMEKEFAPFCESTRVCVVSGGARGIDQKSHSIALRKQTPTVVVLPSGLGQIYPSSLVSWEQSILDAGGCLLSEYPFDQKMHKHLFHHRNRLIAALGMSTLLVEAKRRSGTLITAKKSIEMGRSVWVVPGHPLDPHFGGSLDLLFDGAQLIRDAQDLTMLFCSEIQSSIIYGQI